ncbi:MAG: alpha/beta hydrolase [Alphaproteobacteria bacterium]|nr:alpha/beta hydrolase [Alphaproteobacteria bacterium]
MPAETPTELCPHNFFTLKDGGRLRYARFETAHASRGTVLVIPGRREFIEKKFAELGQPLLDAGWRLIVVEPRGQGLSTRVLSGSMRQRDHIDDFDTHLNDLRAFYDAVVKPELTTTPLIVHGHSLGGHLTLRWLAEDNPAITAAFLTSPMMALSGMPAHLVAHGLSWFNVRLFGHAYEYAPLQHDFNAEDCVFADNVLTQDAARFPIIENYFAAHPDMAVGGVTWGWLLAALKSMQHAHTLPYLGRIAVPVLAILGAEDKVTPAKETAPTLNFIPRVQTHIIDKCRHDVMNEITPARDEAWRLIDEFLGKF